MVQIDVNDVIDSLKERIGELELDKALLNAQLKAVSEERNNVETVEAAVADEGKPNDNKK